MPRPLDWQAFQRNCVILFRAVLRDPNAMEYGRNGQTQQGIDILGRRGGVGEHHVGIQCRCVAKPLKFAKIMKDCRDALRLKAVLKEIIFVTTAKDDRAASDAALEVERQLAAEGHAVSVAIYGWGALQNLVATHEEAYLAFCPSAVASNGNLPLSVQGTNQEARLELASQIAEALRLSGLIVSPETVPEGSAAEDPGLHAKIDTYRDLLTVERQPLLARKGLSGLLGSDLTRKPWALFRIRTNLASVAFELGEHDEAATLLEAAHAIRPNDPSAIANLALARTVEGRFAEGVVLARASLTLDPKNGHAVLVLLQAIARTDWTGEPDELVPAEQAGTEHADLGIAEFIRRRDSAGWAERSIQLAARHPDSKEFRAINATAVLFLALEADSIISGGIGPVTAKQLASAADDLKELAQHQAKVGYSDERDRVAYLSNACLLLRLCGRHADIVELLGASPAVTGKTPQLRLQKALALTMLHLRDEALSCLSGDTEIENSLYAAELLGVNDPEAALEAALGVSDPADDPRLAKLRWRLVAETALACGRPEAVRLAVVGLRNLDPTDTVAAILEIRQRRQEGVRDAELRAALRSLAKNVTASTDLTARYFLACDLLKEDLPEEACQVLDGRVDLRRASPAATLWLQCLASARRDEAFHRALATAAPEISSDGEVLWLAAAHAWNIGQLEPAEAAVGRLLTADPQNGPARLLKVEIFARQNRFPELMAELAAKLEDLSLGRLQDRFRVASLLGYFGYRDRAAAYAYRLFLENRDEPQAWITLSNLVLGTSTVSGVEMPVWTADVVAEGMAVDVAYDDGGTSFFVIEPNRRLRGVDQESWEPDHPLATVLAGLAKGATFVGPDGRPGVVQAVRHKYVARFHHVLDHFRTRFPDQSGFEGIRIAPGEPGGLDELLGKLKGRKQWFEQEMREYSDGPWPLGVLASRLGTDTIDAAEGLAANGVWRKVASGGEAERAEAAKSVRSNGGRGCVLDLASFWTAWNLGALNSVVAVAGRAHVAMSVLDQLEARRSRLVAASRDGLQTAGFRDGQILLTETTPEDVQAITCDTERAIAWLRSNATIVPLVAGNKLPPEFREHLRNARGDTLDALAVASHVELLLLTDDLPTRQLAISLGNVMTCWTHHLLGIALSAKKITKEAFVASTVGLIEAKHDYIGVSGETLLGALVIDAKIGSSPGRSFNAVVSMIGGPRAEPISHVRTAVSCLLALWSRRIGGVDRERATALMLRRLLYGRAEDFGRILGSVLISVRLNRPLELFVFNWIRGNFIPLSSIPGFSMPEQKKPGF